MKPKTFNELLESIGEKKLPEILDAHPDQTARLHALKKKLGLVDSPNSTEGGEDE